MDSSPNHTSLISTSQPAVSTPKALASELQSCADTPIQNSSPASDSSFRLCKTPIRSKRKLLVTRALSREGLHIESTEERLTTCLSLPPARDLLSSAAFFHNTESSLHKDSVKPLLSVDSILARKLKLRERISIQSNITQDEESASLHPPVDYPALYSIQSLTPIPYQVSRSLASPYMTDPQQCMESFFSELQTSIKDKKSIDDKFLFRLPEMTEKLIELKTDSSMLPAVVLEQMEETLRGVVQILGTEEKLITQEFNCNLQTLNRMLNCKTSEELPSVHLFCNLEKKLVSCEKQIRSAIGNVACRGLVELKKLAYPAADIQLLSLAILTLFSEVDCNIDVNVSCKVMSSRAWECMTNYLNKPGEVMQTLRKFTEFVTGSKISCLVFKKVTEQFLKLSEEGLRHADFSYVTIPLYRFLEAALKYYDIYSQIKLHLPPTKKKIMKQPVPRHPSAKKTYVRSKPELKSPLRNKSLVKSPQKVKQNSVQNDDKTKSSSSLLGNAKSKPFIPKLNLQKALKLANIKKSSVLSTQNKSSQNAFVETLDAIAHKTEIKTFGKYKPVRSTTLKAKPLSKIPVDAKSVTETSYSLRNQYSLSLGEDKSYLFTRVDTLPQPSRHSPNVDTSHDLTKIPEKPLEVSIHIQIDSNDNVKFTDNTPKFSEGSENKFEIIEELSEKLTFREQSRDQDFSLFQPESESMSVQEVVVDLQIDKEKETPKETLKETPKETLKKTPKEILKETPKETLKETPKETLKETPKETLKETPQVQLSVANFECMSLPLVCPVVCTQTYSDHNGLSKPLEDLQKFELKLLTISDAFPVPSSQEPPCSFDVSSIELDESIRNLIPLVSNIDEFYKDWASRIMESSESCTKGNFRKRKVREILKRRGISQDYSNLNRSFTCEEASIDARKPIQTQNTEQLRPIITEQETIQNLGKIRKSPESNTKYSNLKPVKSVQKPSETKESAKKPQNSSPKPLQKIALKRSRDLNSSSEFNSKDHLSRSLSKSSLRPRPKPAAKSKENSNRSFSKADFSSAPEVLKNSSTLKREEYENMMNLAKHTILKERHKLQGLLDKYKRR